MTKLSINELLDLHDKTRVNVSVGTIKKLMDKSRKEGKQEVLKELKAIREQFDKGKEC